MRPENLGPDDCADVDMNDEEDALILAAEAAATLLGGTEGDVPLGLLDGITEEVVAGVNNEGIAEGGLAGVVTEDGGDGGGGRTIPDGGGGRDPSSTAGGREGGDTGGVGPPPPGTAIPRAGQPRPRPKEEEVRDPLGPSRMGRSSPGCPRGARCRPRTGAF